MGLLIMSKKNIRRHRVFHKKFLNRDGIQGAAHVFVELLQTSAKAEWAGSTGYLTIGDCTRSSTLEFDIDTKQDKINSLQKIDKLFVALKKLRKGLKKEIKVDNKRIKHRAKKEKKNG